MKKRDYYLIFFSILLFCILFQGITNVLSKQPFLTFNDIVYEVLPYMIFIMIIIFFINKYGNRNV